MGIFFVVFCSYFSKNKFLDYENTKHKTQKLILLVALFPTFFLSSCFEDEIQLKLDLAEIRETLESNNYELEKISPGGSEGIKILTINELEEVLRVFRGELYDSTLVDVVLARNNVESLPNFHSINFELLNHSSIPEHRINCVHNWRTVYGRIGISGVGFGSTWIDVSWQTGTGTGYIENFDAVLGGLTFMTGLAKNNFVNTQIATADNNYAYSGIYTFSIRYLLYFEGIGEVWTGDTYKVRIRLDGCTGDVSYSFIEI